MSESAQPLNKDETSGYCNDLQKHGRLHMEDLESISKVDKYETLLNERYIPR